MDSAPVSASTKYTVRAHPHCIMHMQCTSCILGVKVLCVVHRSYTNGPRFALQAHMMHPCSLLRCTMCANKEFLCWKSATTRNFTAIKCFDGAKHCVCGKPFLVQRCGIAANYGAGSGTRDNGCRPPRLLFRIRKSDTVPYICCSTLWCLHEHRSKKC